MVYSGDTRDGGGGGGRKKDEGDEEGEAKGDNRRQVERRHKFISKKMWDDGPE